MTLVFTPAPGDVETIAQKIDTATGTPWEGIGTPITPDMDIPAVLKAANLDWQVIKRPVWTDSSLNEEVVVQSPVRPIPPRPEKLIWRPYDETPPPRHLMAVPGNYTLLRSDTMSPICPFVGAKYKPIQNDEAFEVFADFLSVGSMSMETAGSLRGGLHVWALAKIEDEYELSDGERIAGYMLLTQSHSYGTSMRVQFTPVRYPGGYMMVMPVNVKRGMTRTYTLSHARVFNDKRLAEIKQVMGVAHEVMIEFVGNAKVLAGTKVSDEDTIRYFLKLFQPDLLLLVNEGQAELPRTVDGLVDWEPANRTMKKIPGILREYEGCSMPSCRGTAWGLVTATNYAMDTVVGRSQDNRLASSWIGQNGRKKQAALRSALGIATKK